RSEIVRRLHTRRYRGLAWYLLRYWVFSVRLLYPSFHRIGSLFSGPPDNGSFWGPIQLNINIGIILFTLENRPVQNFDSWSFAFVCFLSNLVCRRRRVTDSFSD